MFICREFRFPKNRTGGEALKLENNFSMCACIHVCMER